jgi:signal transduction histidine kinase
VKIVDLQRVVDEALTGLAVLERRGIRLTRQQPESGSCQVRADRQWLQRALGNLVQNSVDALGEEGGEIWVRVSRAAGASIMEVEDSAGGIPEAQLQELFSPHFSTTTAGSGLGLALVHQVVTRCQGSVSAKNGERGLIVRLEFPPIEAGE